MTSDDIAAGMRLKERVFVAELLQARGFKVSRPLTRMVRGPNRYPEDREGSTPFTH
jgi:hypothetical protein